MQLRVSFERARLLSADMLFTFAATNIVLHALALNNRGKNEINQPSGIGTHMLPDGQPESVSYCLLMFQTTQDGQQAKHFWASSMLSVPRSGCSKS